MSDETAPPPLVPADAGASNDDMDDGPPTLVIVEESSTPPEGPAEMPVASVESEASAATPNDAFAPTPPTALPPAPALTPPPTLQPQSISKTPVTTAVEFPPVARPILPLQTSLATSAAMKCTPKIPKLHSKLDQKLGQLAKIAEKTQSLPAQPSQPVVIQAHILPKPPQLVQAAAPVAPEPPKAVPQSPPPQLSQQVDVSVPHLQPVVSKAPTLSSNAPGPCGPSIPPNARPKARPRKPRAPKPPAQPQAPVMLPPQPNQQSAPIFNQVTDPQLASLFSMIYPQKSQAASLPGHVKIAPRPPKLTGFPMTMNMQMGMHMPPLMAQFCSPSTSFSGIDMHRLITPQHAQQPSGSNMQQAAPTFQVMNAPPVLVNNSEQRRGPIITEIDDSEADGPPQLTSEVDNEVKGARVSEEASTALAVEAALSKGVRSQFYPIFHFIDGLIIEEGPTSFKFDDQLSDCDADEEEGEETDSEAEQEAIANVLVKALRSQLNIDTVRVRQGESSPSNRKAPAAVCSAVAAETSKVAGSNEQAKKRSPKEKKIEKKEKPNPIKEKVRKRRSKKTDELQKLLNMDFGPGEAPFRTTSKEEYVRSMKKKEAQSEVTPRRAAAVAAKKSMESMEIDEPQQKPSDEQSPPKRAAAVAARKSMESLEDETMDSPEMEEEEVLNPTDLRLPPPVDQADMPRSAFDMPTETYCLQCRKSLRDGFYRRHPQYCSKACRKLYRRGSAVLRRQSEQNHPPATSNAAHPIMSLPMTLKMSPISAPPSPPHPMPIPFDAPIPHPLIVEPRAPVQETPKKAPTPAPVASAPAPVPVPVPIPAPVVVPVSAIPAPSPAPLPSTSASNEKAPTPRAKSPEEKTKQKVDINAAMNWSIDDLGEFLQTLTQSPQCVAFFREHMFDGRSFLLLNPEQVDSFKLKLGPRIKIRNTLSDVKSQILEKPISSIQNRGEEVDNLMNSPVDGWTQGNVGVWATKVTGSAEVGDYLRAEEIDGITLVLLADELDERLSQKMGPWLNFKNALNELKSTKPP